jgi:hypothetical protein
VGGARGAGGRGLRAGKGRSGSGLGRLGGTGPKWRAGLREKRGERRFGPDWLAAGLGLFLLLFFLFSFSKPLKLIEFKFKFEFKPYHSTI